MMMNGFETKWQVQGQEWIGFGEGDLQVAVGRVIGKGGTRFELRAGTKLFVMSRAELDDLRETIEGRKDKTAFLHFEKLPGYDFTPGALDQLAKVIRQQTVEHPRPNE